MFLIVLKYSPAFYEFCEFVKVPLPSDITTFREHFGDCIEGMFHNIVDITEPICRDIDEKKSGYMNYDTSGVEANVKENNPKFLNTKLDSAKKFAKNNPGCSKRRTVQVVLEYRQSDKRIQHLPNECHLHNLWDYARLLSTH